MKIAILMPYRNSEKTILETLASVSAQTYDNYLLVAVNNNSTDDSETMVRKFCRDKDVPVQFLSNKDGEFSSVLNKGLFWILGNDFFEFDAVARLDSDDVWLPEKLEKQVAFLESHPEIGILGTQIENFSEEYAVQEALPYPLHDTEIKKMLFDERNPFAHPSVMIRTDVFHRCGVYDEIYRHCEDYQYWMKASKYFQFANLPDALVKYRIHLNPNYNPAIPVFCRIRYGQAIRDSQ